MITFDSQQKAAMPGLSVEEVTSSGKHESQSTRTSSKDAKVSVLFASHVSEVDFKEEQAATSEIDQGYCFTFPSNSTLQLKGGRSVDISHLKVDLTEIFRGGIGYGGGAAKLMARAMESLGHTGVVYNLPFCLEGLTLVPEECYRKIEVISTEDSEVPISEVSRGINDAVARGCTHVCLPMTLDGHASLATFVISGNTVSLRFYDSLSPDIISYDERYRNNKKLLDFLKSMVLEPLQLAQELPEVLHLLDQGDEDSWGCGYYTLYTAMLLRDKEHIRQLTSPVDPVFNKTHDKKIRAELAIITLLDRGLGNVDASSWAMNKEPRDGVFSRLGVQLEKLTQDISVKIPKEIGVLPSAERQECWRIERNLYNRPERWKRFLEKTIEEVNGKPPELQAEAVLNTVRKLFLLDEESLSQVRSFTRVPCYTPWTHWHIPHDVIAYCYPLHHLSSKDDALVEEYIRLLTKTLGENLTQIPVETTKQIAMRYLNLDLSPERKEALRRHKLITE